MGKSVRATYIIITLTLTVIIINGTEIDNDLTYLHEYNSLLMTASSIAKSNLKQITTSSNPT